MTFRPDRLHVAFFDFEAVEEGFAYETLLYVNHIIRTAKTV